jgi:site-specific DNA-cytosine methylase
VTRIGSMFAGLGGLDLACEWEFGGTTAWQLDLVGADIRRRHFPDALQVEADVRTVDPLDLPPIDVLCGGFPCTDLSVAGQQAGLDGEKSGLYSEVLRFARVLRPDHVVLENVPGLLQYRERLETDWDELGYGLTWVQARALDAGAPHRRSRVFVVARLGGPMVGVLEAPRDGEWTGEERPWATPIAKPNDGPGAGAVARGGRQASLAQQVRPWATVTAANPNEGEDPASWEARRARQAALGINGNGISEPLAQQVRAWATPSASDASGSRMPAGGCSDTGLRPDGRKAQVGLNSQVRPWPTPLAADADDVKRNGRGGLPSFNHEARQRPFGKRLNPDWTEVLMGLPQGWTEPTGPCLTAERAPLWPRGRYPETWDRSVLWPGFDWEPPRTIPDGQPMRGRPARIRACGNAVCPQQGALAIRAGLDGPRQLSLF